MTIFLLTFTVFLLALTGMAIGVIVSDRRIRGSCGGLANLPGMEPGDCPGVCNKPCPKRRAAMRRAARKAGDAA